jgi:hypothetical protein
MRASQWVLGLVGAGAVVGLAAGGVGGCGSSSSGSATDGGDDSDGGGEDVCAPQIVSLPDSGTCASCETMMCGSELTACNADCTCGGSVNMIAGCLANLPPVPADGGGGLTSLLGSEGLSLISCIGGAAGGGGGALGGLGGGGGLLGGGAPATTPMSSYLTCLITSCATQCFGVGGDAGLDAASGADTGAPDSATDTGAVVDAASDTGTVDAPAETSTGDEGSAADASDGGSDGPSE